MPSRTGPVHVATSRRHYKGRVYVTHLLRRTYREGGKVKNETVGNISHLPPDIVELVREALRGTRFVPADEVHFRILRTRPHGHVAAALGTLRKLGLERLLSSRRSPERDRVVAMIVSRILEPASKLATARRLHGATATSTLGEVLELGGVSPDDLYQALDWLGRRQWRIEKALAERHLREGVLLLYDVTSTYFEGRSCPLAALGHNRDGKKNKLQILIGLLCASDGCPVAVEVFPGNTGDPTTLGSAIHKVRGRFGLRRVVFVGDRGLLTHARIKEELRPVEGLDWISALRAPSIGGLIKEEVLELSLFDEQDLFEITSPDYPGERLIACRNPLLAQERDRKRRELIECTERELEKIARATRRKQRPLRGKDKIGVRVGRVLGRYKVGKHFHYEITEDSLTFRRNTERIEAEASLDGIYVIRTSVSRKTLKSEDTVQAYKDLAHVERAFRSLKTVDLEVRPIHHRRADRVKAHVFLCMLAYYVLWHMKRALAPILFQDDQPEAGRRRRTSVVARAQRSETAQQKAAIGLTSHGEPVHDFHSLLADLATLAKNCCCPPGLDEATFEMFTEPTSLQNRAFELLGVSYRL
jgi:hypothetical protein